MSLAQFEQSNLCSLASLSLNRIPLDSQHCSKLFLHGDFCLPYEPPLLCTALSVGGTRVLNANLRVRSPSDFSAAGVKWQYRLGSTAETLSASGTLTQAAVVEVLVGRTGNNVQFTYEYVVYSTTIQPPTTPSPTSHPLTTQPTGNVTRTFSATNQPFGEQQDRSLCALLHHVNDCSALNARSCMV